MTEVRVADIEAVWEAYRKSARFHNICRFVVAEEMMRAERALEDARHDPSNIYEVVDHVATGVAARVLQTVYENDAELKQWKELAERLQATNLNLSMLSPIMPTVPKP